MRGRPPYHEPVRCRGCGHLAERTWLRRPDYLALSLRGIHHLAPGDCEPDEFQAICPDCGAVEPFDPAMTCAECLERPCVCGKGLPQARGL